MTFCWDVGYWRGDSARGKRAQGIGLVGAFPGDGIEIVLTTEVPGIGLMIAAGLKEKTSRMARTILSSET